MGYRNDILELLYKILSKTYMEERLYNIAGERCKRLLFKNFFKKLSHQKRCFFKRIKYEIQVLENEIRILGEDIKPFEEKWREITVNVLPVIRMEREGLIKDCYRREKKNIEMFNNLMSRINSGNIREMLLFQKHSVQLILNEIESMGMRISELTENEKGERNFI